MSSKYFILEDKVVECWDHHKNRNYENDILAIELTKEEYEGIINKQQYPLWFKEHKPFGIEFVGHIDNDRKLQPILYYDTFHSCYGWKYFVLDNVLFKWRCEN